MTEDEFNERLDALQAAIGQARLEAKHLLGVAILTRDNAEGERKTDWRGVTVRLDKCDKALHKALNAVTSIE